MLGLTTAVIDLTAVDFERLRKEFPRGASLPNGSQSRRSAPFSTMLTIPDSSSIPSGLAHVPALVEKLLRKGRQEKRDSGEGKMFEPEEIKKLLGRCRAPMKAIILLGVNAGFGNNDAATLKRFEVDLDAGWVVHARPEVAPPGVAHCGQRRLKPCKSSTASDRSPRTPQTPILFS